MSTVLEIIKITIPAVVVFIAVYFTLKGTMQSFMNNLEQDRKHKMRSTKQNLTIPARLQAYERLALFLERTNPSGLIHRLHRDGMPAKLLQAQMLNSIRTEFDHNLSQQIYVSNDAWSLVKKSKDEMINLINIAGSKMKDGSTGIEYSKVILEMAEHLGTLPSEIAANFLKDEARSFFG